MKLDPGQERVATHFEGPMLAVAVAGSGKTTSIAARLVNMVRAGIDPRRILATTFSVKGAEEIRRKLVIPLAPIQRPDIGTLHSVAWRIVRAESKTSWKLDDRNRYETIVKQVLGYQGMRWEQADHDVVLTFIGLCKAEIALVGSSESIELAEQFHAEHGGESTNVEKLLEAYDRAEEVRKDENLLTFDDQLVEAACFLQKPEIAARWRGVWDYIIQDEAQDQNRAQAAIVDTLAEVHRNYLLVGDPAQCIYAWRGARFDRLLAFAEAPWSAEVVRLEHSYRCGPAVAKVANRVLGRLPPEQTQYGRTVVSQGAPDTVDAEAYDDGPMAEAEETVERIQALIEGGVEKRDIAVLYRIGEQSTALEERLLAAKVPFRVVGGVSFFERKEVANLLAYVRLVEGRGTAKDIERSLKAPFRFLSVGVIDSVVKGVLAKPTATWNQLAEWLPRAFEGTKPRAVPTVRTWAHLIDELARLDEGGERPGAIVARLLSSTNYIAWLKKDEGEDSPENNRARNALEVQRIAERFETLGAFLDFVDAMIRGAAAVRKVASTADVVTLSTIHRAKGLEWPYVFLTGISDGLFPHSRAHADEELRLLYVACTRAKKALRITGSMQFSADGSGDRYPPQFIRLATGSR